MNRLPRILLLAAALGSACTSSPETRKGTEQPSVFPSFTIFPSQEPLPAAVIADLPRRIWHLPAGRRYTLRGLLRALDLLDYTANVSQNYRWSTYFLYLDEDNILYFRMDTETLAPHEPLSSTDWNVRIEECQMRRNPDLMVVSREFTSK